MTVRQESPTKLPEGYAFITKSSAREAVMPLVFRGIYLTQPTTTCSVWGCGRGLSENADGTRTSLLHRGSVQTLSVWPSLARWICLPALRWQNGVANVPRALAGRKL